MTNDEKRSDGWPAEAAKRFEWYRALVCAGLMTINGAREREGLPGIGSSGDAWLVPFSLLPSEPLLLVIRMPGKVIQEQRDRIKADVEATFAGKPHPPVFVLGAGMDIQLLTVPQLSPAELAQVRELLAGPPGPTERVRLLIERTQQVQMAQREYSKQVADFVGNQADQPTIVQANGPEGAG